MKYYTTLHRLREANACARGYDLIAAHVGHDYTGNIDLLTILEVNGMGDCIWAMRATDGGKELATAFAIYCAERVYKNPAWTAWAARWMSGEDRSEDAAAWSEDAAARSARSDAAWSDASAWSEDAAARSDAARAAAAAARSAAARSDAARSDAARSDAARAADRSDAARAADRSEDVAAAARSAVRSAARSAADTDDARSAQVEILKELLK